MSPIPSYTCNRTMWSELGEKQQHYYIWKASEIVKAIFQTLTPEGTRPICGMLLLKANHFNNISQSLKKPLGI